jgi:hydrogenase/urease accessory protein HupE
MISGKHIRRFCHPEGLAFFFFAFCSLTVFAHTPDTSYTKVRIEPNQIVFTFTFDISVLNRINSLDRNSDGHVTKKELTESTPWIRDYLENHILITFDSAPVFFDDHDRKDTLWSSETETVPLGDYASTLVHLKYVKSVQKLPTDIVFVYHVFDDLGERHVNLGSFEQGDYHQDQIVFSKFEPDYLYDTTVALENKTSEFSWERAKEFVSLGMKHIFTGYDHLLFLCALVLACPWKQLIKIITIFTIAHSCSLFLASFHVIVPPSRAVETAVALTIVFVALENLLNRVPRNQAKITFCFGLIHGFAFANALNDLELPKLSFAKALLTFNLGVEAGQLVVIAILLPLLVLINRLSFGAKIRIALSCGVLLCGLGWMLDRASGIHFMPF